MLTLIEILRRSEEYLRKHGIPDARRNAELLAGGVLGKSRLQLYLEHDRLLETDEIERMRTVLAQRKERRPIQYIFGETEFFGLPFSVNPSVLIPRPETELLVEEALKALDEVSRGGAIVYEIGTGSGCISVSIAKHSENCRIYASDISAEALKTASANAARNGVRGRIEFLLGQDFEPFRSGQVSRADIVVANPPYVAAAEFDKLEPEVRDYEPRGALDGGSDGLDAIKRIVKAAPESMNPAGIMLLEIGMGQSEAAAACIGSTGFFVEPKISRDYQGIDRVITAKFRE
jgi:release factor glutamine methyltransferase